jgi:hypothetical protein
MKSKGMTHHITTVKALYIAGVAVVAVRIIEEIKLVFDKL